MELQPLPDFLDIPHIYEPILYPGFAENMAAPEPLQEAMRETGLAKGMLKKVRSLLSPLHPLHEPPHVRGTEEPLSTSRDLQKKVPSSCRAANTSACCTTPCTT